MRNVESAVKRRFTGQRQAEILAQVRRLQKLPRKGYYTLLHHEGPFIEKSRDLMDRVAHILFYKPHYQVLTRLKNIHYMTPKRRKIAGPIVSEYCISGQANTMLSHVPCTWPRGINNHLYRALKDHLPYCTWDTKLKKIRGTW
jgi:hypothetical protein